MNSIWVIIRILVGTDFAFISAMPETSITHTFASYELCEEHLIERFKLGSDHLDYNLTTSDTGGEIYLNSTNKNEEALLFKEYCYEIRQSN